IKNGYPRDS
nr:RecName: Full=Toxin To40; AltName: Full=Toxin Tc40 [Tityus obscurus]